MILLGKIAVGLVGTAFAGAGLLCSEGFVDVNVVQHHPNAPHIHVIAPAILAPIALRIIPSYKLGRAGDQIQPWLPTIRAALDGLSDAPDLTLVEVSNPDQYVHVAKEDGDIIVDVANPEETVHVSVPLRAIGSSAEALAAGIQDRNGTTTSF
jgi:hypothetical protein